MKNIVFYAMNNLNLKLLGYLNLSQRDLEIYKNSRPVEEKFEQAFEVEFEEAQLGVLEGQLEDELY